jgi:hypothetical protein
MNVIVETPAGGFVENEWLGRTLAIGDEVQIGVALPDPLADRLAVAWRPGLRLVAGRARTCAASE